MNKSYTNQEGLHMGFLLQNAFYGYKLS